jgi:hypothetical protein
MAEISSQTKFQKVEADLIAACLLDPSSLLPPSFDSTALLKAVVPF